MKRHELGKVLGKGNYSVVKLAQDKDLKLQVAVKCMTKSELTQEDKDALLIEVDVLFNLDHPSVIKLFGWYESPRMCVFYCAFGPRRVHTRALTRAAQVLVVHRAHAGRRAV